MRISLDTNAYGELMRGRPGLVECVELADVVQLPAVALGELCAGFRMGGRPEKNFAELAEFLELPGVEIVNVDRDVADRYGMIVRDLKERGALIPTNDIWIAAATMETGSRLVTYDSHFENVPGLAILTP